MTTPETMILLTFQVQSGIYSALGKSESCCALIKGFGSDVHEL
jgi:hypothetical protein